MKDPTRRNDPRPAGEESKAWLGISAHAFRRDWDSEEDRVYDDRPHAASFERPPRDDCTFGDHLAEAVRRLVETLAPESVYLFGSVARGEATKDSDCDLMVIVSDSGEPRHRRAQRAYRALRGIPIPVEVLVLTRQEFERQLEVAASLPSAVRHEGQLLYAAGA